MIQQQSNQTLDRQSFTISRFSAFTAYKKEDFIKKEPSNSHSTEIQEEESSQGVKQIQKRAKIYKKKDKPVPYKSETKNIPKNFGVLLKKYLCLKTVDNAAIKSFLKNGDMKKNFSRQDFTRLFNDEIASQMARDYFSSFQIIHDLMISDKIQDVKNHLKYISKFYSSTYNGQELAELKLQ